MAKKLFSLFKATALVAIACVFVNCSSNDDPNPDPEEPQQPANPNAALAGLWSEFMMPGYWIISPQGEATLLQINVISVSSKYKLGIDSTLVECAGQMKLDYNPDKKTIKVTANGVEKEASVEAIEANKIQYKLPDAGDLVKLSREGNYISEAPRSIEGFHMCALRYKVHGILYGSLGEAQQHFYRSEIVDNIISSYTYTKEEGNKAHISYHVKYHLNNDKQRVFFNAPNVNFTDATFELKGELDLTFFAYLPATDYNTATYFGEFDGNVEYEVTNHRTEKVTKQTVTGKKYFALIATE